MTKEGLFKLFKVEQYLDRQAADYAKAARQIPELRDVALYYRDGCRAVADLIDSVDVVFVEEKA